MANDLTDIHMPDLIGLRINVKACEFRIGVSIQLMAIRRAIKIKKVKIFVTFVETPPPWTFTKDSL